MANTFISLNDTPSSYTGNGSRFIRVNAEASELVFGQVELNDLSDVQANLAYTPQGGQALVYSAGAGKWRPGTMDVYSAGNGLNKNALTLNVVAGAGGGLTSNSSGVFITDIDDVAGTWGNASYVPVVTVNSKGQITDVTPTQIVAEFATTITNSFVGNIAGTSGQIRVTGGTGNNSNAVIDLVATGVTAATYGNATHLPQITVDTYGRIQNVDLVEIAAGSGDGTVVASNTLGFANIVVSGQTTVSAERPQDTLTLVAGTGTVITTQANADIITFGVNAGAVAGEIALGDLADVDTAGITNGQALIWNSSTGRFQPGSGSGGGDSNVDLTDFSIVTAAPSGNGSLSYNNAGVFTFTPANVQTSAQSLSWNASNYTLTISGGNSVDLSVLSTDLTGYATESYVDAAIANIAPSSSYGDSNVLSLLGNVSTSIVPSANNTYSLGNSTNRWSELFLSGNSIYIDTGVLSATGNTLLFNSNTIATTAYVDNAIAEITNGAAEALDTLGEIANALNNSNATLSTVAFSGDYSDLANKPSLSLAANTFLVFGDANIDLSTVVGQEGPQGPAGDGNAGISTATVNGSGNLIISLNNNTVIDAGNIKGEAGDSGNDGVGIVSVSLVGSNLVLDYSNTSTQDVGNIRGPKGDAGNDGLTVTNAAVNGSGNLIITLSDTSTLDAGNVKGADGSDGIQLSNISVITGSPSGNGSLSYNNTTGVFTFAPADLSNIPASYGNTEVQAYLDAQGYSTVDSDSQTLTLSGSNLSISGGNSVDLSGLGGSEGGIALTDLSGGTGISYSNVSGVIALANTAVTPGTYGSTTKSPRITVDAQGRITSVTEATISGGGGGSGATVERFKLNYTSSGSLASTANLSAGIASVSIDSTTGGECTITFANGTYFLPPAGIMFYGYDYTNNKYQIVPMETSMGYREVPAGGTSGAPTLFDAASQVVVKLRLREAETGASRGGFGTTTHAWIQFVMYD